MVQLGGFWLCWNWPMVFAIGQTYYDGDHYFCHLGLFGVGYSP